MLTFNGSNCTALVPRRTILNFECRDCRDFSTATATATTTTATTTTATATAMATTATTTTATATEMATGGGTLDQAQTSSAAYIRSYAKTFSKFVANLITCHTFNIQHICNTTKLPVGGVLDFKSCL